MAKLKPVTIEYERDVVSTAEGATLSAMLVDLSRLVQKGAPGEVFRRIYGTATERSVEDLRRRVRDNDQFLFGGSILVSADDDGGNSRAINAREVVLRLKDEGIRRSDGSAFEETDFDPNLRVKQDAKEAFKQSYGEPMLFASTADLDEIERIAELAANIGVSVNRVDIASLPSFSSGRERDVVRFRVVATYRVNLDEQPKAFVADGDFLRFNAQRPGGQNFDASNSPLPDTYAQAQRLAFLRWQVRFDPTLGNRDMAAQKLRLLDSSEYLFASNWAQHRADTFATLRVIKGGGPRSTDPFGSTGGFEVLFQTNRFLLQQASEATMERTALIETFGPTYLYLFGTKSKVWSYSGILFDTEGMDWVNEWRQAYERFTGGTQTARMRARVFLTYDNVVREGIIIATNIGKAVGTYGYARFSFQMFIIKEHYLDGDAVNELATDLPTFISETEPAKARERQYAVQRPLTDLTSKRETTPAFGVDERILKRSKRVEELLVADIRADLERDIVSDAFPHGRLERTSGTVFSDVENEIVKGFAQNRVRFEERRSEFVVEDGKIVQRPDSRKVLFTVGTTGDDPPTLITGPLVEVR